LRLPLPVGISNCSFPAGPSSPVPEGRPGRHQEPAASTRTRYRHHCQWKNGVPRQARAPNMTLVQNPCVLEDGWELERLCHAAICPHSTTSTASVVHAWSRGGVPQPRAREQVPAAARRARAPRARAGPPLQHKLTMHPLPPHPSAHPRPRAFPSSEHLRCNTLAAEQVSAQTRLGREGPGGLVWVFGAQDTSWW
jgi:hypothetical protein